MKDTYKKGTLDGEHLSYFENGQLQEKGFYRSYYKEGCWVRFHENGAIHLRFAR